MSKRKSGAVTRHKILVVEDQPVVREGIARMLDGDGAFAIYGEEAGSAGVMERIRTLKPAVVIADLGLISERHGFAEAVHQQAPETRVLVFSQQPESVHAVRALAAGANGYLMRNHGADALRMAVRRLIEGKTYVSEEVNQRIIESLAKKPDAGSPATIDELSERERQVLALIGRGYPSRRIAEELHMSIKTVETHRQHMKAKLQLATTFQLVQRAIDWVHHQGGHLTATHHPID